MKDKYYWEVQLKGDIAKGSGCYELSVIRSDDRFGHESWGWGNSQKIILFSSGVGGTSASPEERDLCMTIAKLFADTLNANRDELALLTARREP